MRSHIEPDPEMLFHHLHGFLDWTCGWFQKWYFLLRLEEEAIRCVYHDLACSIIVVALGPEGRARERNEKLAELAFDGFRETTILGVLSYNEYAVMLPETDRLGAESVARRLASELQAFSPRLAISVFPHESSSLHETLRRAWDSVSRDYKSEPALHLARRGRGPSGGPD